MNIGNIRPGVLVELVHDTAEVHGPGQSFHGATFFENTRATVLGHGDKTLIAINGRKAYVAADTQVR